MIKGKIQTENIVKRGTFCGEHSEKGTSFLYFEHTVYGMFRNPLFNIGTKLTWKHAPGDLFTSSRLLT